MITVKMNGMRTTLRTNGRLAIFFSLVLLLMLVLSYGYCSSSSDQKFADEITKTKSILHDGQPFFGIMFDAGSTGSRIHVYQFAQQSAVSPLKLMNETFVAVKPGLSSYKEEPIKGARSLVPLLELAMEKIPKDKRRQTPVALKATAGLRLLPGNLANIILNKVGEVIKEYPFHTTEDSVQIMDGTDEGIFSWMTVNFLLGSLTGANPTVAALDLGGGSTQVTFVPEHQSTFDHVPKDFLMKVKLFSKQYRLYTHSYLGLGLMSARFQILGGEVLKSKVKPSVMPELSSPCLPTEHQGKFEYQGTKYIIRGLDKTGFESCYNHVKSLIRSQGYPVDQAEELKTVPVYIFSYYYDRAVESGLIDARRGGEISLSDYKRKAISICDKSVTGHPFLCMDLTFIYTLLLDGFGMPDNKQLVLKKKISGVEISWALGAMFDMLSTASSESR